MALDLYHREHGVFPGRIEDLTEASWVAREQLRVPGHVLRYRSESDGQQYRLELIAEP
jgi:hypothetical protein